MNQNSYVRTDLAAELRSFLPPSDHPLKGIVCREEISGCVKISRITIEDQEGERLLGKPRGAYVTLSIGKAWLMSDGDREEIISCLGLCIKDLISRLGPEKKQPKKVLIAGLGNRNLTADTVGPFAAEGVTMTRPIALSDPSLFEKLNHAETSVIIPCVMGETGIESAHLVKSAVKIVKPDLVIAVDALAARSPDRLLTTLQICDTGIAPGSGVGNGRASINRSTMGVPVIAIGVPTVVDSSTLIYDALEKSGISPDSIPQALTELLNNQKSFFVSAKDCDIGVRELSRIISAGIDLGLSSLTS